MTFKSIFSFQGTKPSILPEETAEELAEVISPELKPKKPDFKGNTPILKPASNSTSVASRLTIDEAGSSILSQGASGVTLLSIGQQQENPSENPSNNPNNPNPNSENFSAKL